MSAHQAQQAMHARCHDSTSTIAQQQHAKRGDKLPHRVAKNAPIKNADAFHASGRMQAPDTRDLRPQRTMGDEATDVLPHGDPIQKAGDGYASLEIIHVPRDGEVNEHVHYDEPTSLPHVDDRQTAKSPDDRHGVIRPRQYALTAVQRSTDEDRCAHPQTRASNL